MDGRGASSCVMFGSAPSCPSFSVSLLVKFSVAGRGGAGKGGSCVLISDLVVMAKIILVLDIFFNSNPPFFFGERVEAELSELVEFPTVILGYVIMKDLHQKPFLCSIMGDLVD
ncbi:hypothetical protein Tco_0138822 [Tanacetum coccineum]